MDPMHRTSGGRLQESEVMAEVKEVILYWTTSL
jgi:hypothetical protein